MTPKKLLRFIHQIVAGMTIWSIAVGCSPVTADLNLEDRLASDRSSRTPNILLVIADDLGIDAHPCYPVVREKPNMPTIAKLCQQGVVFDNAWAYPVCTPTRASILTGKYGFRTKVGTVDDLLSTQETSIQQVLSRAPTPYKNAVIGKWHVAGANPDPNHPQQLGVEFYSGFMRGAVRDYANWEGVEQGR
jgi:arylsulfatase A-like enzyme